MYIEAINNVKQRKKHNQLIHEWCGHWAGNEMIFQKTKEKAKARDLHLQQQLFTGFEEKQTETDTPLQKAPIIDR